MTRLRKRNPAGRRARRMADRTAAVLPVVGAAIALASPALAAPAWAVGNFTTLKGTNVSTFTLNMHWNGSAWKIFPSPNPAVPTPTGADQTLTGVVEISPNDVWAVGGTSDLTGFQPAKPIALHWNGTAWSLTAISNLGNGGLTSVTASSSSSRSRAPT